MLTGSLVVLRAPQPADMAVLAAMRNDAALQRRLMAQARPNDAARVADWLNRRLGDPQGLFFVIAEAAADRAVGFVQLTGMDPVHGHGHLGIALVEAAQGRGYGQEAIQLLEAHARDVFGLRKIVLKVLVENEAAFRLYRKLGYREVGVLAEDFYHGGAHHDVRLMEHLLV
ncbi:MAG: GNAT family N-acetyltransferase [Candidatus Sericytochromatia bacterium]